MRILHYDCFSGISGDMNLGAMIDLGVDKDHLLNELSKLGLNSEYAVKIERGVKRGITGTKVDIILKNSDHHHEHRSFRDIEQLIIMSSLNDEIKRLSTDIFMRLAQAEARVHGKTIDEVHFHEVGAVDSIVDIVGAAICIDYLKVDKITSSKVELGGGFVKCQHGTIPVPAPATVELLKGIPVKLGRVEFETTTPTGAAILAVLVNEFKDTNDFTVEKVGYGIGTRELEIPNVLRVFLAEDENKDKDKYNYILETNIDDMNPELYGYIEDKLLKAGALDVYKTPIIMKKGRPAIKLTILVKEKDEERIKEVIFYDTTSIGLRKYKVEKIMMDREYTTIATIYGDLTIKTAYYNGRPVKFKPEYEDCRRLAESNGVSINDIYKEVNRAMVTKL